MVTFMDEMSMVTFIVLCCPWLPSWMRCPWLPSWMCPWLPSLFLLSMVTFMDEVSMVTFIVCVVHGYLHG